jgi:aryl-alcohol dehydrogenase-like predicted oxidoreductase
VGVLGMAGKLDLTIPQLLYTLGMSEAMEANQAVVEAVEQLATAKGATAAQVALAWLLAKGPSIVPIFGTGRSDEDMAAIELRLAQIEITGDLLPHAILKLSYR